MSIDFYPAVDNSAVGAIDQFLTVPGGVTFLDLDCQGASSQGAGGRVLARVPVTPGEMLKIVVGREESFAFSASYAGPGQGGGGNISPGRRGGGYAGVFRGSVPLVVAGGGGGFGAGTGTQGNGGGLTGQTGSGPGPFASGSPGTGGTQEAGGAGGAINSQINAGNPPSFGQPGSYLQGGNGQPNGGGGGGGGYYGGGGGGGGNTAFGGNGGGGGGGSSYTALGVTNVIHVQGFRVGAGFISILNLSPITAGWNVGVIRISG